MLDLLHKKCKLGGVCTWSNAKKCKRNLLRPPYRIIGSKKKFEFCFSKLIYYTSTKKFQKNHINIFCHLNWRNELFYTFRGQALKPNYSTIHCISRCYRYLNRREFFTLTQISKNWCQITPLTTICLPKRCSGNIGTFGDLSQKWKSSEIKPLLG